MPSANNVEFQSFYDRFMIVFPESYTKYRNPFDQIAFDDLEFRSVGLELNTFDEDYWKNIMTHIEDVYYFNPNEEQPDMEDCWEVLMLLDNGFYCMIELRNSGSGFSNYMTDGDVTVCLSTDLQTLMDFGMNQRLRDTVMSYQSAPTPA